MTRRMTLAAAVLLVALAAGHLLACGRYGPPRAYPPGVQAPDDEHDDDQDDEEHQSLDPRFQDEGAPALASFVTSGERGS